MLVIRQRLSRWTDEEWQLVVVEGRACLSGTREEMVVSNERYEAVRRRRTVIR